MRRLAALLIALTSACGGGTPEAQSPEGSEELYEEDAVEQTAAASKDGEDGGDEPADTSDASAPGGPASPEDMQQILELVINDEALDAYLHLEEPGRFPLQISGGDVPSGVELTKATKPVKIVTSEGSKTEAVLVFTSIEASAGEARVKYRYDVEGIRGSATLKKVEGRWQLINSRVSEYYRKDAADDS
jgi:hypothetical protein